MLPSKCRTLKKKAENKENIEGTGDSSDNSTSSTTPGVLRGSPVATGSPALPRKQRDKSPSSLLGDSKETTFTRDRKGGFFSSFMKKKSAPQPPKRSSSFREMENQPHKRPELTGELSAFPHLDGIDTPASPGSHKSYGGVSQRSFAEDAIAGVGGGWTGISGFFTPRLIKKTFGLRTGKSGSSEDQSKPFPRSNSTSSMSPIVPEQDRMAMTLPRNCHRTKVQLDRAASVSSQPDENQQELPRTALDIAPPQPSRDRVKSKMLPRTGGSERNGGVRTGADERSSPSKQSGAVASSFPAAAHNHKVPVLISPSPRNASTDSQLVGMDSLGHTFKLLQEHVTPAGCEKDRPSHRRLKPKCAPPPPPNLRFLQQPSADDTTPSSSAQPVHERASKPARPLLPPPPPVTQSGKLSNGAAGSGRGALRKPKQPAEKVPAEKISKEALLQCAGMLSTALTQPQPNSQLVDTGHQLLDYCTGYVDSIPQTRNKFAFREAVSRLEVSLQELQVSSAGAGAAAASHGSNPVLNNLLSCVQEISDVVQR
ncbi:unnamed protein product [Staurois parvus]|uniref:F-actin binding domain-containing protein n=1 Tax=Staurois parvus TaxID=386267 RepID=A0ABN9FHY1_9NEOB|nr:unnamed protein product [Staurois parvus]